MATTAEETTEQTITHASLAEALAAFQGETPTFPKTKTAKVKSQRTNSEYSYKYADLGDILPVVGPLLAKHGLSWSSKPVRAEDGTLLLRYTLRHTTDGEDSGEMPLGVEPNCKPQELGSAITYMRRYAMTAQLNIATEEDDDGKAAQDADRSRRATNGTGRAPTAAPAQRTERPASAAQRSLIFARAGEKGMEASLLANVVLLATDNPAREWENEDAAQAWLGRSLDRLPSKVVDKVLEGIAGGA